MSWSLFFGGEGYCLSWRVPDHLFARPYFGGYRNKMTGAMWGCSVEIGVIITHIDILINIPYLGGGFKYFLFSSLIGEDSHFDEYFSIGLKPPTSYTLYPNISWSYGMTGPRHINKTPATHLALSIPSGCLGIDHTGYIFVGDVTRLSRSEPLSPGHRIFCWG